MSERDSLRVIQRIVIAFSPLSPLYIPYVILESGSKSLTGSAQSFTAQERLSGFYAVKRGTLISSSEGETHYYSLSTGDIALVLNYKSITSLFDILKYNQTHSSF